MIYDSLRDEIVSRVTDITVNVCGKKIGAVGGPVESPEVPVGGDGDGDGEGDGDYGELEEEELDK